MTLKIKNSVYTFLNQTLETQLRKLDNFLLYNFLFLDINECLRKNDCEHICFNLAGSYACGCRHGYTIRKDGRTCQGKRNIA